MLEKMKVVYYLSGPHINVEKGYWLYDELKKDGYEIKSYYLFKYGHSRDFSTKLYSYFRPIKLLMQSRKNDLILLYDVTSAFILIGFIVSLFRLKRKIVAVNFMGSGNKNGYDKWKRPIIRKALKMMRVGVNNIDLQKLYCKQLRLKEENFFIVKDCAANVDLFARDCSPANSQYVFMGGNVHRDWNLFKEIVKDMPEYNFVAVLGTTELEDCLDLPNLKVYKRIPLSEFNTLVAKCKIVFLPLNTEMQGGQLVAFQGSMYKKPVIITKCLSINTYYDDTDAIKVPIGNKEACEKAITNLMSDDYLCAEIAQNGHNRISELLPERIYTTIKEQF